jgi:hypothetical protein
MPTESFLIAPTVLTVPLHSYRMLAYHDSFQFSIASFQSGHLGRELETENSKLKTAIRNFGTSFEPRYIVGAGLLDQ